MKGFLNLAGRPPVSLGESQPTNTSTVGLIAAAAVFAVSFRLQVICAAATCCLIARLHRAAQYGIESAASRLKVHPSRRSKTLEVVYALPCGLVECCQTEFIKASGPETAAWCANVISSSLVAAIVKPMVDGKGTK